MKYLAIVFFCLLAIAWYYISWKLLKTFNTEIYTQQKDIITAILLAGLFAFGFLLSKVIYKNNYKINNSELNEKKLEKDFFLPEIKEINEENKYKNYENDSVITKDSIDIILDEREENYKHKFNLKKEILKEDFQNIIKIKGKDEEIIDKTFLNVANSIKKRNKQDLKIIEGIGPKIEQLLNNGGIYSYKDLANSEIETLQKILSKAGKRYFMLHKPITWSKQANIINKGNLEELKKYQKKLVKGIEK